MTLREIVKELRDQGHSVVYRKRTDGSIAILSIDSERFSASSRAGNRAARMMTGETVSRAVSAKRSAAGLKGGIARGAQRTQTKIKSKKWAYEKDYQRLRRAAKKKGLKPIGKKQIKAALKRGEKWKDVREKITRTLISRFSKIAGFETRKGVAIYLREKGLSDQIADFIESNEVMMDDLQHLHDAAYDAVQNGTDFNESYWLDTMRGSAERAKQAEMEANAFAQSLKRTKRNRSGWKRKKRK